MVAHAPPRIIGHRGAKGSAPENTLASICAAKAQGCAWVEVDVMLSKDKFEVIHHDNKLDRCTDAHGYVWDLTFEELQSSRWLTFPFLCRREDSTPPVIACCHENALLLNLEVKQQPRASSTPTAERHHGRRACDARVRRDRTTESAAAGPSLLFLLARVHLGAAPTPPHITCAFLVDHPRRLGGILRRAPVCSSTTTSNTREQVEECRRSRPDVPLFSYTVNDPLRWALTWGVSGVFSDHPALVERESAARARGRCPLQHLL